MQGKIERIPELGLGKFHFIDCEGVLHHLKVPHALLATTHTSSHPTIVSHNNICQMVVQDKQLGLDLLADSLTEDGGMTVMVYARYHNLWHHQHEL